MCVLMCGLTTIDISHYGSRPPRPNEKVAARSSAVDVGGPAANAARVAACLGVPTRLATCLGDGVLADLARNILTQYHVHVLDIPGDDPLPISSIFVDDSGQRTVSSANNAGRTIAPIDDEQLDMWLTDVSAVCVDAHLLDIQVPLARQAQRRGIPVVFDGGSDKPGTSRLLPYISHAIVSADFSFSNLNPADYALAAQSHGDGPIQAYYAGQLTEISVPRVSVRDTLGAGDVLHGAFTALLPRHDALTALRQAASYASESTTLLGLPSWLHTLRAKHNKD
ncbi:PfkB family carbohydrate kinase [Trueperella sp. LYQ143]|uniref:PfkB family carbohydrate kinase n=1 Tax=Trueperella sp. LYQ143 TaxID=3391059 RepID=UPI0039839EA4